MAGFVPYKLPKAPDFQKYNVHSLDDKAMEYDKLAYQRSDRDFAKRHGNIVQAENLFADQTLKDQRGESELMPALQNEYFRSGLSSALGTFGTTPGTLAPGSAGEASVARNLGVNILGFQDRNRQNRQNSLNLAEQIFPRRSFGISGADAANIEAQNISGENSYDQTNYANQVGAEQSNYNNQRQYENSLVQQGNANAQAKSAQKAGTTNAAIGAGGAVLAAGLIIF